MRKERNREIDTVRERERERERESKRNREIEREREINKERVTGTGKGKRAKKERLKRVMSVSVYNMCRLLNKAVVAHKLMDCNSEFMQL